MIKVKVGKGGYFGENDLGVEGTHGKTASYVIRVLFMSNWRSIIEQY